MVKLTAVTMTATEVSHLIEVVSKTSTTIQTLNMLGVLRLRNSLFKITGDKVAITDSIVENLEFDPKGDEILITSQYATLEGSDFNMETFTMNNLIDVQLNYVAPDPPTDPPVDPNAGGLRRRLSDTPPSRSSQLLKISSDTAQLKHLKFTKTEMCKLIEIISKTSS